MVQGASEVYPVSSSAQLALLPWLAGWSQPADRTQLAAGLHAGSTVGLALALRDDLAALRLAEARGLALSAAPAAVAGLLLQDVVERRLGGPRRTAVLMAASAAALWVVDRQAASDPRPRDHGKGAPPLGGAGLPRSLKVGAGDLTAAAFAQVAALAPGVSRTGVTLTALRARGVDREPALRTSLLMSLPVTVGAAALTALRGRSWPAPVPSALAGITAYAAARRVPPARTVIAASVAYRLVVALAVPLAARARRRGGCP
ncbi:MAG TPA: undecaprenyl-diphosphate phosphatase [Mycobacteriales bacterium]|nr:undecaprenyl-diphosphate phosphatase [Mycobacteriales bacterium]